MLSEMRERLVDTLRTHGGPLERKALKDDIHEITIARYISIILAKSANAHNLSGHEFSYLQLPKFRTDVVA